MLVYQNIDNNQMHKSKITKNQVQALCEDNFTVGQVIGQGSFGLIFKAYQKHTKKTVALKCIQKDQFFGMDPQLAQLNNKMMLDQVQIMMNCNNPNILKCFDLYQSKNLRVIVLQYCEGGDLYNLIKKQNHFSERKAIAILVQLLFGFATLHLQNVIHRDLKTDNVFIRKGVFKIADFGVSKRIQSPLKTNRGTIVGSKISMAPEIIFSQQYGIQVDMWSLGVVFFEMLFGFLPFKNFITEQEIRKVNQFLYNRNCSFETKDLLIKIFIIEPQKRLKWVQLYKMYNYGVGIFSPRLYHPEDNIAILQNIKEYQWAEEYNEYSLGDNRQINLNEKDHYQDLKVNNRKQIKYVEIGQNLNFLNIKALLLWNIVQKFTIKNERSLTLYHQERIYMFKIMINFHARKILGERKKFIDIDWSQIVGNRYQYISQNIRVFQNTAGKLYNQMVLLIEHYHLICEELSEKDPNRKQQSKKNKKNKNKRNKKKKYENQNSKWNQFDSDQFLQKYVFYQNPGMTPKELYSQFLKIRDILNQSWAQWRQNEMCQYMKYFQKIVRSRIQESDLIYELRHNFHVIQQ